MKTKKADLIAKIFITAVIVVLVGLLIAWMTGVFKDKKQDLNSGTEKIDTAINSMADFDLMIYDDNAMNGEALVEVIKDVVKKAPELSLAVQTLSNAKKTTPVTIYYNKALTTGNVFDAKGTVTTLNQSSKSSDNYITPSASFKGQVLRNSNDEITGILFTQQK